MGQPDDRLLLDDWLARSRAVALPDWKLYSGLGLTGEARAARLVRLVERARAAEVSGQPRRADFFWREAHRSLHAARASTPDWIAIARDVFWATHWALLRGRLRRMPAGTVSAEDRAFEHLAWIETLAESLPDEAATARESREAGLIAKADALQRAGRRPEALRAAEALRRLAPEIGDYLGRLASARLAVTAHELERAGDNQGRQQDALRTGIHELTRLRETSPPHLAVLEAEALLRQAYAFRLANTERLSEALVEIHRALALDPYLDKGRENSEKFVELMQQLQARMRNVQAELRSSRGQLSAIGHRLVEDAKRGFGPLEQFLGSPEAERLRELHAQALARSLWSSLGQPEPATEDPGPRELLLALREILDDAPAAPEGLETRWQSAIAERPSLQRVNPDLALGYLHRRLFPGAPDAPPAPAARVPQLADGPVIETAVAAGDRDGGPFGAWLYSGTDLRVKAQCALAAALLLVVLPLGAREYINRDARDAAYAEARRAADAGDARRVMDAAARFFGYRLLATDARDVEVGRLYDEALVTWVVSENPSDAEVSQRVRARRVAPDAGRVQ